MRKWPLLFIVGAVPITLHAQDLGPRRFTHADTIRGSNTPPRSWWDASFYDLHVKVNPVDSSISGYNAITYRVIRPAREMQIDLQQPLVTDSIVQDGLELSARRDGNAFLVTLIAPQKAGSRKTITENLPWQRGRPGTAASSGLSTVSVANGSSPPMKDSAPVSGGRPRITSATNRTASAWPSPFPIRSSTCQTDGCAAIRR